MSFKPLLIFYFVLVCSLSYGQDRFVNFAKPTVRTIPANEFWSFHTLSTGDFITVCKDASFSRKSVFGTIHSYGPSGEGYSVVDSTRAIIMMGQFPLSFPPGLTLYVYPGTSAGVDVFIMSDK